MAGQASIIDDPEVRARWGGFAWTEANAKRAREIVAKYPDGRQMSAFGIARNNLPGAPGVRLGPGKALPARADLGIVDDGGLAGH